MSRYRHFIWLILSVLLLSGCSYLKESETKVADENSNEPAVYAEENHIEAGRREDL